MTNAARELASRTRQNETDIEVMRSMQTAVSGGGSGGSGWMVPIGGIFISAVATNPATMFGYGTWAAFGTGRVLVGIDTGDTDFDTVLETGGSKTATF